MSEKDFKTFINGVGNDLKVAVDDFIAAIVTIQGDVEKLKIKTSKPGKITAQALLEYIAMDEGEAKTNLEILCEKELKEYLKWLDAYCNENACSKEQALLDIIQENG